jgi:hypothetical protein
MQREPNSKAAAFRILDPVQQHLETVGTQQPLILLGVETGMK